MIARAASPHNADLPGAAARSPIAVLALDVPDAAAAVSLIDRVPAAEWVKVGLQLFTAEGPSLIRALRDRGRRVFLDLKLHDIPNTVARAIDAAATLEVDLLTLHASGGEAMLRAARAAVGERGAGGPRLLAVTLLTSLVATDVGRIWGRESVSVEDEVLRLAGLAAGAEMDGVVASVREAVRIRHRCGRDLLVLCPGIRLPGDRRADQARVATPAEAIRAGADFIVLGRSVTAAEDPRAAFDRVLEELDAEPGRE